MNQPVSSVCAVIRQITMTISIDVPTKIISPKISGALMIPKLGKAPCVLNLMGVDREVIPVDFIVFASACHLHPNLIVFYTISVNAIVTGLVKNHPSMIAQGEVPLNLGIKNGTKEKAMIPVVDGSVFTDHQSF